jgi:endonuclease/exonuclease/phosphatase family metal-dependent hydrolase
MTAAKKSKGTSLIIKILLGVNIFFILCLVASYASSFISPGKYWIFAFFGLAYPIWLIINLFFILLWVLLWKKYVWITIAAVLLGFNYLLSIYPIHFSNRTTPPAGSIQVLSYNVHSLYGITNKPYHHGIRSKITDFLSSQNPDIFCIQELYAKFEDSTKFLEHFTKQIGSSNYTYKNYQELKDKRKINALAIFSKFPINGNGYLKSDDRTVFCIYADIRIRETMVRVYNVHLESIHFGNEDYSFYSQLTDQERESQDLGAGSLKIFSKLKKAFILRSKQVDILKKDIDQSPYPLMVCGDFNDPPTSYTYHVLSHNLQDSYKRSGNDLFGNTYAGKFPSFRIDYILLDKSFEPYGYQRIRNGFSDHYPISVKVKISPSN